MSVVVDTAFLIDVARGHAGARALLDRLAEERRPLLIPTVAVAEYLAGSAAPAEDLELLAQAGQVVALDVPDAHAAADLARAALRSGRFPGWADLFIAGAAHARGLPVVTRNGRHFADVDVRTY